MKLLKFISIAILFMMIGAFLLNADKSWKCIDQWEHNNYLFDSVWVSMIDKDDQLISIFYKSPRSLISKTKILNFAPYGQGPSELLGSQTTFLAGEDLVFVERPEKLKIFKKKNGNYVFKETKWLKRPVLGHIIRGGIFADSKYFLAGFETIENKKFSYKVMLLRVYDKEGKYLKSLINKNFSGYNVLGEVFTFIKQYKNDNIFLIRANELKVYVISPKKLEVIKEVQLKAPIFYKKMPDSFYTFKEYNGIANNFLHDIETWDASYSRIIHFDFDKKYLVLQIRTCDDKLKRFAVLFYNAETFKLENIIFTDDSLAGIKDGKYYCFKNGEPGIDEAPDDLIINIYQLEK